MQLSTLKLAEPLRGWIATDSCTRNRLSGALRAEALGGSPLAVPRHDSTYTYSPEADFDDDDDCCCCAQSSSSTSQGAHAFILIVVIFGPISLVVIRVVDAVPSSEIARRRQRLTKATWYSA